MKYILKDREGFINFCGGVNETYNTDIANFIKDSPFEIRNNNGDINGIKFEGDRSFIGPYQACIAGACSSDIWFTSSEFRQFFGPVDEATASPAPKMFMIIYAVDADHAVYYHNGVAEFFEPDAMQFAKELAASKPRYEVFVVEKRSSMKSVSEVKVTNYAS